MEIIEANHFTDNLDWVSKLWYFHICSIFKKIDFLDFFCQNRKFKLIYWIFLVKNANSNIFSWFFLSNCKFKSIFLVKNVNWNIFSWFVTLDHKFNWFPWFYVSKLQIQINLLDFSFQRHKFKYIFKINFLDFSCQNCKYKSIYWIFLVKDTNSNIFSRYITNLDISYYFSCQNLNLNECDGFFLSKMPVFYFWHAVFSWHFLFLNFDLQPFHYFF